MICHHKYYSYFSWFHCLSVCFCDLHYVSVCVVALQVGIQTKNYFIVITQIKSYIQLINVQLCCNFEKKMLYLHLHFLQGIITDMSIHEQDNSKSYSEVLPSSQGVTTTASSTCMLDVFLDADLKGFVCPPRVEPEISLC